MEMTTRSSTSVKAARRRRGVKGKFEIRNSEFGKRIGDCGLRIAAEEEDLDVGFMEEVDRFEARGSRRRKWKVESGKLKFFMNVKVKVNGELEGKVEGQMTDDRGRWRPDGGGGRKLFYRRGAEGAEEWRFPEMGFWGRESD